MKKIFILSCMIALCLAFLSGCGGQGESTGNGDTEDTYYDITIEKEALSVPSETDENWQRLSMQFYKGEVVQFWAKKNMSDKDIVSEDIFLFQSDGSGRLLFENVSREFYTTWYMDEEENFYILNGGIVKLDKDGKELWRWTEGIVSDICQLSDGKIMLLVKAEKELKLAELESGKGEVLIKENLKLNEESKQQYIGVGKTGLLLLDKEGFWEVDVENNSRFCVMPFEGTSYNPDATSDFRFLEDGRIALIKNGEIELLQLSDIRESKTIITVRNNSFDAWQKDWVEEFNRRNEKYYVVLESLGDTSLAEFRERTGVEIATGKGPDIVGGDVISDVNSLIQKGALEDLTPYMEKSGICEEDYFPCAFSSFRDEEKVYAVNMNIHLSGAGYWIKESVIKDCEKLDIQSLVNALYEYDDRKVVFKTYWEPRYVMQYVFFVGTEDFWGMVDWENSTCDFSGELFAKVLEVAKRYGYSEEKKEYTSLADFRTDWNCYDRQSIAQLEAEGKRYVGYLSDDGCHTMVLTTKVLAINSNSSNKEGAWEFISFMLGKEAQSAINSKYSSMYPVNKNSFSEIMEKEMEEGAIGETVTSEGTLVPFYKAGQQQFVELGRNEEAYRELYDLTEETVREIEGILEDTRTRPTRTLEIQSIIYEEAEAYFNGAKSIEEVVKIIENRVQLYLQENG